MRRPSPERLNLDPRPQPRGSSALCEVCSAPIMQYPSRPRRFCSLACRDTARRTGPTVECVCTTCGGRYMLNPRQARRSKYCSRSCQARAPRPGRPPTLTGGRKVQPSGYVIIRISREHPCSSPTQYQGLWALEHRVVMAEKIGRLLLAHESVHHVNGVKTDNRPCNLELWIRSQPAGQRVQDVVEWARFILDTYATLA